MGYYSASSQYTQQGITRTGDRMEFEVIQWLVNQGVAIFVTAFLLIRIEAKLEELNKKIGELCLKLS